MNAAKRNVALTTHYVLPASDPEDRLTRKCVRMLTGKPGHARQLLKQLKSDPEWRSNHVALKFIAIAHQHLEEFAESESLLHRLLEIARHDTDRAAALANLAAGFFRQEQYEKAYLLAQRAIQFDEQVIAPWLIAAAAVARIEEEAALTFFCERFAHALARWKQEPAVARVIVNALTRDPDLEEFVTSGPFMANLEDQLLDLEAALGPVPVDKQAQPPGADVERVNTGEIPLVIDSKRGGDVVRLPRKRPQGRKDLN